MGSSVFASVCVVAALTGVSIPRADVEKQKQVFSRLWNDEFKWRFDDLPTKGDVAKGQVPYSGYIYLDKWGGTSDVLRKYDLAVNRNRSLPATSWERSDTSAARGSGFRRFRARANDWYGHCNGWSAAATRHAEPQRSVHAHGTVFTPSDIKGLLAEVYMYNDTEMLAGYQTTLNAGTFHAILANWIGRGSHAIVMDSDPGKEKWNYPIYSFASSFAKLSPRRVEVRTNILHAKDTEDREYDRSPAERALKSFHYTLDLNSRGEIIGGQYHGDSARIDFVWVALRPKAAGEEGNEAGNPHVDVDKILAIWRKSVPAETRRQWLVVDPAPEDQVVEVTDPTALLPRNIRIVPRSRVATRISD